MINEESTPKEQQSSNVIWVDTSPVHQYFAYIKPWQRINHFPGMVNIARKSRLAENLEMMKKKFDQEYNFFPRTFVIPRDLGIIQDFCNASRKSKKILILKPDGGAQGKGIFLTRNYEDIRSLKSTHVAQEYIANPLLIEGKKFDLRIYVLVTSCDPLRIYLFNDGLVRLCTEDFVKPNNMNMDDKCMHLTNFSINRTSEQYEDCENDDGDTGSKRSVKWLMEWLSKEYGGTATDAMWTEIGDICVKTILSIAPILQREYRGVFGQDENREVNKTSTSNKQDKRVLGSRCFEVLGIDIMIDSDLKPHMIEVNHLPSFATGSPLDESIKSRVIQQALSVVSCSSSDQRNYEAMEKKRMMERNSMLGPIHQSQQSVEQDDSSDRKRNDEVQNKTFQERVTEIYTTYAPDKLDKIDTWIQKYQGYEEWFIKKLEDKYIHSVSDDDEENEDSEGDSGSNDEVSESQNTKPLHFVAANDCSEIASREYEILVEKGDYQRIYPSCGELKATRQPLYLEMQQFAKENDEKEQQRLTRPLWLQRKDYADDDDTPKDTDPDQACTNLSSRGDWLLHGNVHIKKQKVFSPKIIGPPSQKQVEAAERLSKGFSVEDRDTLHKNSVNDSFIERIFKAEEIGKQRRKCNEDKALHKTQLQVNPINLQFAPTFDGKMLHVGSRFYIDFAGRKLVR